MCIQRHQAFANAEHVEVIVLAVKARWAQQPDVNAKKKR